MVLYCRGVNNDPDCVRPDPFSIAELLLFDEGDEFHHFTVWFNLGHVRLYGELLATEQTRLLAFIDVEWGESVNKHICAAVVVIPLDDDIGYSWRPLLLFLLHLNCDWTEVVGVDQYVVVVTRFEGKGVWGDVLLRKVKGAHGPGLVAFELSDRVTITVLHSIPNVTWE